MSELRIVAPLHSTSGYASAGRALVRTALLAGYTVEAVESERDTVVTLSRNADGSLTRRQEFRVMCKKPNIPRAQRAELAAALETRVSPEAPTLLLTNPTGLCKFEEYCECPRIGLTMWETDDLHPLWSRPARNVDVLGVPSAWNLDVARRLFGDKYPVRLMPLPTDRRIWQPKGSRIELNPDPPDFMFLSVFSVCERKNWKWLLQAFAEEFRGERVGLICKVGANGGIVEDMAGHCRAQGAWVGVIGTQFSHHRMVQLYRRCAAFVLPSTEGFGLPYVEAAMMGMPSIGLDGTGSEGLATWDVRSHVVPAIGHICHMYPSWHDFFVPDLADLKATMRAMYDALTAVPTMGESSQARALAAWSCEAQVDNLRALIDEGCERYKAPRRARQRHVVELAAPPVALVVTTHNAWESTERLLASVMGTLPDGSVIVIADDHSTDGTPDKAALVSRHGLTVKVMTTSRPGSVCGSRQDATELLAEMGWDGWVVYSDNDVEYGPGWWQRLCTAAQRTDAGIIGPRQTYGIHGRYGAGMLSTKIEPGGTRCIGHMLNNDGHSWPLKLERDTLYPCYVESACMAVRADVWQGQAWDFERFAYHWEDVDYCCQARARGFEVVATNDATVAHHAHTSSRERWDESMPRRLAFIRKWKGKYV
jgi:GT2 family glycosyltransferase